MLMSAINGPARKLAATIKAYAEKKEAEGDAPSAPKAEAAPSAEEKPAEEAKAE